MSALRVINRRRFLGALGLGGAALALPSLGYRTRARGDGHAPARIVFFVTPHGTVPSDWRMRRMGDATDYAYDLAATPEAEWSPILRPLYAHRDRLLVVDGVAKTTAYAEIKRIQRDGIGHDANEHHLAQAHLLTCDYSVQRTDSTAIGGARSLDQVIGDAVAQPGQWGCRVYGYNHQHPYSFVAPNEPAPRIDDPRAAFADIMGLAMPATSGDPTREQLIDRARGSVLDFAAEEYAHVIPRLGAEDREKLQRHQQLIRDLELSLAARGMGAACDPSFVDEGTGMEQFSRLVALTFACDLTRVVTFVSSHLGAGEFGADPGIDIHQDIAHNSTDDAGGYTPEAAAAMTRYNVTYARKFNYLLDQLASVPELGETMLDHTVVVWLTELATGTHWLRSHPHVLAGGANGYFRTGRYVHFAENVRTPFSYGPEFSIGPSHSQLYVSLMHAMGMTDRDSFGLPEVTRQDGSTLSLRGPLPMLTG